jgi:orotidine-5'-phosphate decarboxylase
MTELRAHVDTLPAFSEEEKQIEDQREAHMRLAVASALGETQGAVAVVCGAWHVPALRRKVAASEDRALLKGLPKIKGDGDLGAMDRHAARRGQRLRRGRIVPGLVCAPLERARSA